MKTMLPLRSKLRWPRVAWLVAACLAAGPALAQDLEEPGSFVEDEDRARIESADHLRYEPAEGMYYLNGNVVFAHKEIKLYCDEAIYDYDENSAVAKGNPKVVDPETTITGDLIEANFEDELATISGNVTAVTQKKPAAGPEAASEAAEDSEQPPRDLDELREKRTTITAERVKYEYADTVGRMTATGRVKAVQEDKTVYANQAVYEEKPEIITLTGDVRIITDKGDELRCPSAVISISEDWIRAENVQVVGKRRRDEGEQAPPAEETPPAEESPPEEPPAEEPPQAAESEG